MIEPPVDLDDARRIVGAGEQFAEASGHLTTDVAMLLEFHELVPFKSLLKRFFSAAPWTAEDATRLSGLIAPHLDPGAWWEHELAGGVRLSHGMREGGYVLWVGGAGGGSAPSLFDRVFSGPVTPEATPHPRKVKFNTGGTPAPGRWYRRSDDLDDPRVAALLAHDDVTDVMVAGDFVTVGLARDSAWEDRLDALLGEVTDLFWDPDAGAAVPPERTRDELVAEGTGLARRATAAELHLLDPDDPEHRRRLEAALDDDDARVRRVAVATLALAGDPRTAGRAVEAGYADGARLVRRTAVDAAADREDEAFRPLFESALADTDPWTRWKAVRALAELGLASSRDSVAALADDPDFQVRMEVAAALRD